MDRVKVYFSARDARNKSSIYSQTFSFQGGKLVKDAGESMLELSYDQCGDFAKDGISMGSYLSQPHAEWIYFLGWHLTQDVPWRNSIGLMQKAREGNAKWMPVDHPVIPLSDENPHSLSYPWVIKNGEGYEAYYGSNRIWGQDGRMEHVIKKSRSRDGLQWDHLSGHLFELSAAETAFSRPAITPFEDGYLMVLSVKGGDGRYTMQWKYSENLENWKSVNAVIEGAREEWESNERAYGSPFFHKGDLYVLYNGDGYGKTGFGALKLVNHE